MVASSTCLDSSCLGTRSASLVCVVRLAGVMIVFISRVQSKCYLFLSYFLFEGAVKGNRGSVRSARQIPVISCS